MMATRLIDNRREPSELRLDITVVYAAPGVEEWASVSLPAGATVDDAVHESGIIARLKLDPEQLEFAIFGQRVKGGTPLESGDRLELTRPLIADPKRLRRNRATKRLPPTPSKR
ncbi:MAG: RnfH family protein [Betaproteobacteria bacterium]